MNNRNNKRLYTRQGQPAYQSYAVKKKLEISQSVSRRELNLKASYKKLLRKELKQEELRKSQTNNNPTSKKGVDNVLSPENNLPASLRSDTSTSHEPSRRALQKSNSADWIEVTPSESNSRNVMKPCGWKVAPATPADYRKSNHVGSFGWTSSPVSEKISWQRQKEKSNPSGWTAVSSKTSSDRGDIEAADNSLEKPGDQFEGEKKSNRNPSRNSDSELQERIQNRSQGSRGPNNKPSALKKATNAFLMKKQERVQKESMFKRQQEERKASLQSRKKKRLEKFKILNQKTSKGQPVMKGRMQLLLQKIQSSQ